MPEDSVREILTRLIADVDDAMEFYGTPFNPKVNAADKVAKRVDEAEQKINTLFREARIDENKLMLAVATSNQNIQPNWVAKITFERRIKSLQSTNSEDIKPTELLG